VLKTKKGVIMTSAECIAEVASQARISKPAADRAISSFVKLISVAMATRGRLAFPGGAIGHEVEKPEPALLPNLPLPIKLTDN
jgi:hypothetical protein